MSGNWVFYEVSNYWIKVRIDTDTESNWFCSHSVDVVVVVVAFFFFCSVLTVANSVWGKNAQFNISENKFVYVDVYLAFYINWFVVNWFHSLPIKTDLCVPHAYSFNYHSRSLSLMLTMFLRYRWELKIHNNNNNNNNRKKNPLNCFHDCCASYIKLFISHNVWVNRNVCVYVCVC